MALRACTPFALRRARLVLACMLALLVPVLCAKVIAQPLDCDFTHYHAGRGPRATALEGNVLLEWGGDPAMTIQGTFGPAPVGDAENRAIIGLERGQPMIRLLATTNKSGDWVTLVRDASLIAHVAEVSQAGERELLQRGTNPARGSGTPEARCRLSGQPVQLLRNTEEPGLWPSQPTPERQVSDTSCEVRSFGTGLELSINASAPVGRARTVWLTVRHDTRVLRHEEVLTKWDKSARPGTRPGRKVAFAGLGDLRRSGFTRVAWLDGDRDICQHSYAGSPAGMSNTPLTVRAAEPVLVLGGSQGSLAVVSPSEVPAGAEPASLWHWQGLDSRVALGAWKDVPHPGQNEVVDPSRSPDSAEVSEGPYAHADAYGVHLVVHYYLGTAGPREILLKVVNQHSIP